MAIDLFNSRAVRDLQGEVAAVSARAESLGAELVAQRTQYESRISRISFQLDRERHRFSTRQAIARQGGYSALKIHAGEESPSTHSWTRTPMNIDDAIQRYQRKVRARSRQVARSDEVMIRFLNLTDRGVVGPDGVSMQAQILNQNGEMDKAANDAVADAWRSWGEDPACCDIEGRLSWVDLQSLHIRTVAKDGEFLARKIRGQEAGPYGFAIQVLDPELLDIDFAGDLENGNKIRFGIEYNAWWRPVAYWLRTSLSGNGGLSIGQYQLGQGIGRSTWDRVVRIPAEDIIHSYVVSEACQRRGWPWAFSTLLTLAMLGGYEEAALFAARVGASKFFVLEMPEGDGAGYQGDERKTSGAEGDTTGSTYIDAAEPGHGWIPPRGGKLSTFDPSYPNGEFDPFTRATLRRIASGLDVSYMSLSGDLSQTSYASGRQGLQDERDVWMRLHGFEIRQMCRPCFNEWLPMALLSGQIAIKGNKLAWTPDRQKKFSRVFWQGRTWPWIDPEADVAANVTAIEQGLTTRTEVVRSRTRRGFDDLCKERQQENTLLAQHQIEVPVVGAIPGGRKKGDGNA